MVVEVELDTTRVVWKDAAVSFSYSAGSTAPSHAGRLSKYLTAPRKGAVARLLCSNRFADASKAVVGMSSKSLAFAGVLNGLRPHVPVSVAVGAGSVAAMLPGPSGLSLNAIKTCAPKAIAAAGPVFANATFEWEAYSRTKDYLQRRGVDATASVFIAGGLATTSACVLFRVPGMKLGSRLCQRAILERFVGSGCGFAAFEETFRIMYSKSTPAALSVQAPLQAKKVPKAQWSLSDCANMNTSTVTPPQGPLHLALPASPSLTQRRKTSVQRQRASSGDVRHPKSVQRRTSSSALAGPKRLTWQL
mmetsp:Transcript_17692/g.21213  ORF Transcript_17692/g.21213 Transcript_17692/m.21213 type:complete len:305 (+) Transcript_17692:212-1126(+)|eukprot:CAMPEP_0197846570 /NCGR_PEP_ID=MMETSP1438-20131217/3656_1 /TAXON_ID=1461541 /ORGANISM="Pterosperma sp., Strain CCMP1384" /LENGTH=304 /DNA_ID=CAMNT_0043458269 /DNA_START=199 /DNA_END=1113 /DNA_ORIENTATION=+